MNNKEWNVGFAPKVEDEEENEDSTNEKSVGDVWDKQTAETVGRIFKDFYNLKDDDFVSRVIAQEKDAFVKQHNLPSSDWFMDKLTGLDRQIKDGYYPDDISPKMISEFLSLVISKCKQS